MPERRIKTRGAAYDNTTHLIPSIDVSAIIEQGNGGKSYFKNETVGITSEKGVSDRFWPDQRLSFFAYAVSKDNVSVSPSFARENGVCKGSFNYALPAAAKRLEFTNVRRTDVPATSESVVVNEMKSSIAELTEE